MPVEGLTNLETQGLDFGSLRTMRTWRAPVASAQLLARSARLFPVRAVRQGAAADPVFSLSLGGGSLRGPVIAALPRNALGGGRQGGARGVEIRNVVARTARLSG